MVEKGQESVCLRNSWLRVVIIAAIGAGAYASTLFVGFDLDRGKDFANFVVGRYVLPICASVSSCYFVWLIVTGGRLCFHEKSIMDGVSSPFQKEYYTECIKTIEVRYFAGIASVHLSFFDASDNKKVSIHHIRFSLDDVERVKGLYPGKVNLVRS